ncbi:hypothetical protein EJ07DRAFT_182010 [Lizonia empirigonia]|nr:hypothetical protein EJ07DRAFT_182010 [Lizonia empirigonia]
MAAGRRRLGAAIGCTGCAAALARKKGTLEDACWKLQAVQNVTPDADADLWPESMADALSGAAASSPPSPRGARPHHRPPKQHVAQHAVRHTTLLDACSLRPTAPLRSIPSRATARLHVHLCAAARLLSSELFEFRAGCTAFEFHMTRTHAHSQPPKRHLLVTVTSFSRDHESLRSGPFR